MSIYVYSAYFIHINKKKFFRSLEFLNFYMVCVIWYVSALELFTYLICYVFENMLCCVEIMRKHG